MHKILIHFFGQQLLSQMLLVVAMSMEIIGLHIGRICVNTVHLLALNFSLMTVQVMLLSICYGLSTCRIKRRTLKNSFGALPFRRLCFSRLSLPSLILLV